MNSVLILIMTCRIYKCSVMSQLIDPIILNREIKINEFKDLTVNS